jgi:thiol-disulfide isomerase/thioredoxin
MRRIFLPLILAAVLALPASAQTIVAKPRAEVAGVQFATVLQQALGALAQAGSYSLEVQSKWGAANDPQGPAGGSRYRLIQSGGKYRVEVQSQSAQSPELVCVNDGQQVTTYFPARALYSQHAANSPQAGVEGNTMLYQSLQGSALDIILHRDVAGFVGKQATGLTDHGEVQLGTVKARHFELFWAGAKVQLWFAAEGPPLLLQFTRSTSVPMGDNQNYEMVCTAKYQWKLGAQPAPTTFVLAPPNTARQVNDIYDALAGDEAAACIGKPLPKLQLAKLDGSEVELAAAPDKRATVLIFWATWCASSVEDMPAVSQFVKAYKERGVDFYAINVGEQPGEVRRFTAKSPLVSSVLLDTRGQASTALSVCELPAIAIIGPDNNVRSVLNGTAKELQGDLSAQLDALLAGAVARRPGEAAGKQK